MRNHEKLKHVRYVRSAQGLNTSPSHFANCCTIVMASVTVIIVAASLSRVSLSSMGFFLPRRQHLYEQHRLWLPHPALLEVRGRGPDDALLSHLLWPSLCEKLYRSAKRATS